MLSNLLRSHSELGPEVGPGRASLPIPASLAGAHPYPPSRYHRDCGEPAEGGAKTSPHSDCGCWGDFSGGTRIWGLLPLLLPPRPGCWGGQSPGSRGRELGSSSSLVNNTLSHMLCAGRGGSEGQGVLHLEGRSSGRQVTHHHQGRERGGSGGRRQESAQKTEGREKERWLSAIYPREAVWPTVKGAGMRISPSPTPTPTRIPAARSGPVPTRRMLFRTLATRGRAAPAESGVNAAQSHRKGC